MDYLKQSDFKKRPIVIIGAGTLGMRIALMMATREGEVGIFDLSQEQLRKADVFIQQHLPAVTTENKGYVTLHTNLSNAIENAWLILEAIPEQLELKKNLFGELDRLAPADAILASNSSSYPSSQFIDLVSEKGRSRVVNTHFYMPPIQKAVEIMSCGYTDQEVIDTLIQILPGYGGLVPFVVRKESVGFIFNRVWAAIKRECLDVVARGISTPEDIDLIFKVNTGVQIGPFCEMDHVGLDVVLNIEEHYAALNPSLPAGPRKLLEKYISQGKLGTKSGCGFYEYSTS